MAIVQLVGIGQQNDIVPVNLANEYVEYEIDLVPKLNPSYQVRHNCDVLQIEYFHFTDENLTIEQFKNIIKNCSCELQINDSTICNYDFKILIELNTVKKIGNTFVIKAPDYLIKELVMIALQQSVVQLNFNLIHAFQNVSIVIKQTYRKNDDRRIFAKKPHKIMMQYLYKAGEIRGNQTNNIIKMNGANITKGFFVIGNINNIQQLSLQFNSCRRFTYNNVMLQNISHIISDNMFYISFEGGNNFETVTPESLKGSCNLSRIANVECNITLHDINISTYDIYWMSFNFLQYADGTATLTYDCSVPVYEQMEFVLEENINHIIKNVNCPISGKLIQNEYCICENCQNNYAFDTIIQWLSMDKKCPICNTNWTNFKKYKLHMEVAN